MEHSPQLHKSESIQTPEYWKDNLQFVYPKGLFDTQFAFAKLMAERQDLPLIEAIKQYAPLLNAAIRTEDGKKELLPGITDENALEAGYAEQLERRKSYGMKGVPYRNEEDGRFGCSSYDYEEDTKTVRVHFFNGEADEEWKDGELVSTGPLSKEKLERRKSELAQMFREVKEKHPDARYVRGCTNLYNLEAYRRLYPDTFIVGGIDYQPKRWDRGLAIWGQFLGGKDKKPGEYGFKQELADEFLEKAREVPLDRLADALPMPPRTAHGNIQDFYDFYGIK
ncbi:MAG TPA: hypothetical protein VGE53_02020 [Candidatus Paceibacterota bacterium]